ncbi:MAG: hypothetical protein BZY80_06930 [SAR202 cluster bacterium Io17-Chloro-G2]|nr:MAG: hypothetical protein BZY80_06930 [SAR202 cluster bacterium Io17-Chloro-G2]
MATAIDPICQMEVDTDNPPGGQSEHQGTTYYFCGPGCKVAFDREPEKVLAGETIPINMGNTEVPAKKPGFLGRLFGRE